MTLPWASRYMFSVAAAGAFSRKSMKRVSPLAVAQEKKPASAEVSGLRMDHGQRESGGDGGIDSIASRAHALRLRRGRQVRARW